jgi:tellurite resistance protein
MSSPSSARLCDHLPLPLFASVMGLSGLAMVWRNVEAQWGWPAWMSAGLTGLAVAIFIALIVGYACKFVHSPERVQAELAHPVRINFLPAFSINLILLGILITPWHEPLGLELWRLGAVVQLLLTLIIVSVWLNSERPAESINPVWFIPAVGNVLVPVAAAPAGYPVLGWFFFSIGLFFWVVLGTIVLYRLITGPPLEPAMRPSLAILMAPPAVAALALQALSGEMTQMVFFFYAVALFLFLLLVLQIPGFLKLPYFPSWWAYTFPSAAFTVATFQFSAAYGVFSPILLTALSLAVTVLIGIVLARTLVALRRGEMAGH